MKMRRMGVRFSEKTRWRLLDLLYANDLVLCDERRGLEVNVAKSKVMVSLVEKGWVWKVTVNGRQFEQVY